MELRDKATGALVRASTDAAARLLKSEPARYEPVARDVGHPGERRVVAPAECRARAVIGGEWR